MIGTLTLTALVALTIPLFLLTSGCYLLQSASAGEQLGNSVKRTQEQSQVMGQSLQIATDDSMFKPMSPATPEPTPEQGGLMAAIPMRDTRSPEQLYIQQLQDEWKPRYDNAVDAHQLLGLRLAETRGYATTYFEEQSTRIGTINTDISGGGRLQGSLQDSLHRQRVSYDAWMAQAQGIHQQSEAIMQQLHNMNTAIEFAVVAADFDVLVQDLMVLPASIEQLQQELGQFQRMTIDLTSQLGTRSQ